MKKQLSLIFIFTAACLLLTACKSSDYKNAVDLQEAKDYSAAATLYEELGDYKDSASRLAECESLIVTTEKYDEAKLGAEEKNTELDQAIADAEALIASGQKALDESLVPALETSISEAKAAKISINEMPETESEIIAATEVLNAIDYSAALETIFASMQNLETSISKYKLVDSPEEAYIITCLERVPTVVDISAVTEDNDPNGQLNKAGGYTAQVFFSSNLIDQSEIYGTTIIDKGTDCGGSIEVYANEDDALKRNEYLASFDGTIFASGSHTVIGTVIVRTSNQLTASQQKELEANIISILTSLEG